MMLIFLLGKQCYFTLQWPPLWSSGQSSWLQIQRSRFDSRCYQIFWAIAGLERGPLSLVSTIEELLGSKSCGSGPESREYGRREPSNWLRFTISPQTLAVTSPTSGSRSVVTVRSRTQATEFRFISLLLFHATVEDSEYKLQSLYCSSACRLKELELHNIPVTLSYLSGQIVGKALREI
jgi:hypothetical protein